MAKKDPVSPELHQAILNRDRQIMLSSGVLQRTTCVAPVVDPSQLGMCFGRSTLDHVQDSYGRMGRRAASDAEHLVTICQAHSEAGARAGYQWNTAHRPELRQYLATAALAPPEDD